MASCDSDLVLGTLCKRPKLEESGVRAQCSLKICSKLVDFSLDDRVEVQITLPEGTISTFLTKCVVRWSPSGEALFHHNCWTEVLKNARTRPKKKASVTDITAEEKVLIKEASKTAEFHDSCPTIRDKAVRVAGLIKKSRYCVVFTGAGISTSAGIGDFRGKNGKWTQLDQAATTSKLAESVIDPVPDSEGGGKGEEQDDGQGGVSYESLRPTYAHEVIAKLVEVGSVKHVISQNCDGLHRLSAVPEDKLSELHGNVFVEECEKCGRKYYRSFYVLEDHASQYYEELEDYGTTDLVKPRHALRCGLCGLSHRTGRWCEEASCKGSLKDSIVNFRDNLDETTLSTATEQAQRMDLCISLGSTMRVTPACELVEMGVEPVRLVIVNRQKTGLDEFCLKKHGGEQLGERVYGDCDVFLKEVMARLLTQEETVAWKQQLALKRVTYDSQRTKP